MSSRTKKLIRHMAILLVFSILAGVIAYLAGTVFGRSAIAGQDITLNAWKGAYRNLTLAVAVAAWAITNAWYWLAYSVFSIQKPLGVGKRIFWMACGGAVAGICVLAPVVYSLFSKIFVLHLVIPIIYLLLFAGIVFWAGTIFATPDNYKYTPIGALFIKGSKGGK